MTLFVTVVFSIHSNDGTCKVGGEGNIKGGIEQNGKLVSPRPQLFFFTS